MYAQVSSIFTFLRADFEEVASLLLKGFLFHPTMYFLCCWGVEMLEHVRGVRKSTGASCIQLGTSVQVSILIRDLTIWCDPVG